MRDGAQKNTIVAIVRLTQSLEMFPSLRICQLIDNAIAHGRENYPEIISPMMDIFYLEDDILAVLLEKFMEDMGGILILGAIYE